MGTGSHIHCTDSELANQTTFARPKYGADVQIEVRKDYNKYGGQPYTVTLKHLSKHGAISTPRVSSHKEGIKVGCTFVTNEALEEIYKLHKKFLNVPDVVIHQG